MSFLREVYQASPVWLQNVMVSGQGYIFAHRRWDLELAKKFLSELRQSQWMSPDEFTTLQNTKLRERIKYASTHIPYYAQLFKDGGINPDSVRTVEDLRRIPILEKDTVRRQPAAFLKGGKIDASWIKGSTSGTTGAPLQVFGSREDFSRIWSFVFRLREWAGLKDPIFPRRVSTTGKNIVPIKSGEKTKIYWRRDLANNALLLPCGPLSRETVPLFAKEMKRFKPELISGLPSVLTLMARYASRNGISLPQPLAVMTTGETLLEQDREEVETAFGCKVYDQYASTDTGAFVSECEHGTMHVNPEFGICELLDPQGSPVKPGERGEIVATPFCNTAQVFIRYKTGDSAVAGTTEECACGRFMPRFASIVGRTDDVLFVRGSGYVGSADSILSAPFFSESKAILEAQIVQESADHIVLNLVPDVAYNESIESELMKLTRDRLGQNVSININKLTQIPRGPNGKFRFIQSKLSPGCPA